MAVGVMRMRQSQAIVIENRHRKTDASLETALQEGIFQIQTNQCFRKYQAMKIRKILCCSMAFEGMNCKIAKIDVA